MELGGPFIQNIILHKHFLYQYLIVGTHFIDNLLIKQCHYVNLLIQYTYSSVVKNEKFRQEKLKILTLLFRTLIVGTHNLCLGSKIRKNIPL